ncbi:hypothetical protein EJ110_NYTH28088 [Nymphaea thermarum]|nr:hypothetical protein EJ110_NYTH28088 [Nymphaea thermarum]
MGAAADVHGCKYSFLGVTGRGASVSAKHLKDEWCANLILRVNKRPASWKNFDLIKWGFRPSRGIGTLAIVEEAAADLGGPLAHQRHPIMVENLAHQGHHHMAHQGHHHMVENMGIGVYSIEEEAGLWPMGGTR